jgi:hypothetical protein
MAYTRKASKPDIRALNIKSLPESPSPKGSHDARETPQVPHTSQFNPLADLKHVAWCSIPLILLLILASYLDSTHHWVVPLAEKLLKLGS